jgi:hypothetical protein
MQKCDRLFVADYCNRANIIQDKEIETATFTCVGNVFVRDWV